MKSVSSYFNKTLLVKNITRFWPLWGGYLFLWLVLIPGQLVNRISYSSTESLWRYVNRIVLEYAIEGGVIIALFAGGLMAMAVFSYLYNSRSACLMHTVPIRREGLFLTSYVSGALFLVGPHAVTAVVTLLVELAAGTVNVGALAVWFLAQSGMALFFYSFGVFCAMFTGNILAMPVFYGILNFLSVIVWGLVSLGLEAFVYGYAGWPVMSDVCTALSPTFYLFGQLDVTMMDQMGRVYALVGWEAIVLYFVIGLVLAAGALLVYQKRHVERAGDVVTAPAVKPVFKFGVAFCMALTLGTGLFGLFYHDLSLWAWLCFAIPAGAVGYFASEMLMQKSFRVFGKWKGWVAFSAALVLAVVVIEFDLTGFERRVPDADRVQEVTLSDINSMPYDNGAWINYTTSDPEEIALILDIHRAAVESKDTAYSYNWEEVPITLYQVSDPEQVEGYTIVCETDSPGTKAVESYYEVSTTSWETVHLTYTLKSGVEMERRWSVPVFSEEEGVGALLKELVNRPGYLEKSYPLAEMEKRGSMSFITFTTYRYQMGRDQVTLSTEESKELYAAVKEDLAAGRLGVRYVLSNEERMNNCYWNDLDIYFLVTDDALDEMADVRPATTPGDEVTTEYNSAVTITLQETATSTLAVLEELGYGDLLLTQAQLQGLQNYENLEWEEKMEDEYY